MFQKCHTERNSLFIYFCIFCVFLSTVNFDLLYNVFILSFYPRVLIIPFVYKACSKGSTIVVLIWLTCISSLINIRVFAITRSPFHCVSPYFNSFSIQTAHKSTITLVSALVYSILLDYQRLQRLLAMLSRFVKSIFTLYE